MVLKQVIRLGVLLLCGGAFADGATISVERDVSFGLLPRHVLDIYSPAVTQPDTPVFVLFHGGGFSHGDKSDLRRAAKSLAGDGMIVVAPNYRLYPNTAFPGFVQDAALAVSHAWRNLRTAEGRSRPVVLGGWSAGAYIAALVAYDRRYLEAVSTPPGAIRGFVGLAGPYHGGLCAGETCPEVFPDGTKPAWPVADFVDAADPPMLLIRGTHDLFVDKSNLEAVAASAVAAGIAVDILVVEDAYHEDLLSDLERPESPLRTAVDTFLSNAHDKTR
ncbi:alpha/beta hydrolase [Aliiroseovarius sp. N1Y82]|nr:alpha/beta hydrolase [Aliiroseovarius subalbicans]MCI2399828.1 alpha/beta hydrolase [Aliiroseovarius subalbicans]